MAQHKGFRSSRSRRLAKQASASMETRDACNVLQLLRDRGRDPAEVWEKLAEFTDSRLKAALDVLHSKRLILPASPSSAKVSRRLTLPRISASYGHVIGVDIGGSNLRVALADLDGRIVAKWTASTRSASSPEMVINQIRKGVHHLLQQAAIPRGSLLALAAGAPGVTNRNTGVVFATSYLKGWKNVPLGRLLESALRVPAVVENDVKLAAIGEHWEGIARGIPDFVFLAIGTGIAAGIFVNGQLVHGPDWVAGEVGYLIVPGTPDAPAKRGSPGALESAIGGEGIRQYWLRSHHSNSARHLTATGIFYHALAGDRRSRTILQQSARILAYAIYNISTVLNSSLFVLGGGVGANGPLLAETRRILEPYTQPSQPKLVTSSLGSDAQLVGAIRLALDKAEARIDLQLQ
jgi:glucokinase